MKRYIFLIVFFAILSIPPRAHSQDLLLDTSSWAISPDNLIELIPLDQLATNETTTTPQQCQTLVNRIRKGLPEELDNEQYLYGLLEARGENWVAGLRPGELLELLGESGKLDGQFFKNAIGVFKSEDSIYKINLSKGEFRYINTSRKFSLTNSDSKALGREGLPTVERLISYLGIPEKELGNITARILKGFAAPVEQRLLATTALSSQSQALSVELETTFFMNRTFEGVPVLNSFLVVGLSNRGEISRFRLKWPTLTINPDLGKATLISKDELLNAVYETVLNHIGCQEPETLKMQIAFVPSQYDTQDEDETKERLHPTVFSPKLLVFVRPEDTSQAGEVLEFDLFQTAN